MSIATKKAQELLERMAQAGAEVYPAYIVGAILLLVEEVGRLADAYEEAHK